MKPNPAGSKLGSPPLGRRPATRLCLSTAVFVLALATLGAPAAWADDPVSPGPTTSAEPTPEPTITGSTEASASVATQDPVSEEPTAVPEVPTSEEPDGDVSGPMETGTGGGEGGGTEQAPVVEGTLAAAAEDARDPRASIGDIDCTNLTVRVTLDNSRSTETVTYRVLAGEAWLDEGGYSFEDSVQVSAGAIQTVVVPVTEDSVVEVLALDVPAGVKWGPLLANSFLGVDCADDAEPQDPQARIGSVDCAQMTVDVTLDNSRSEDEMTYIVTVSFAFEDEPATFEDYNLLAGAVQPIQVPVTENVPVYVFVGAGDDANEAFEEGFLADELFRVNCTPGDEPLASIGEVNCTNLTVPVTLDNTRSAVESWFEVSAGDEDEFEEPTFNDGFWVAAGAQRIVPARVPNNARVGVTVGDGNQFGPLADEQFDVHCVRVLARRAGPRLAAGEGALAATGANGLTLPIAGLTLLVGGGFLTMLGRRHS